MFISFSRTNQPISFKLYIKLYWVKISSHSQEKMTQECPPPPTASQVWMCYNIMVLRVLIDACTFKNLSGWLKVNITSSLMSMYKGISLIFCKCVFSMHYNACHVVLVQKSHMWRAKCIYIYICIIFLIYLIIKECIFLF